MEILRLFWQTLFKTQQFLASTTQNIIIRVLDQNQCRKAFVRRSSRFGTTNLPFFEAKFKRTRTKLIVENSANCYLPLLCTQNDLRTTTNILGIVFHSHVWKIIKNVCFFPRHTMNHPVDNFAVTAMFSESPSFVEILSEYIHKTTFL